MAAKGAAAAGGASAWMREREPVNPDRRLQFIPFRTDLPPAYQWSLLENNCPFWGILFAGKISE